MKARKAKAGINGAKTALTAAVFALILALTGCGSSNTKGPYVEPPAVELNISGNIYLADVAAHSALTGNNSFQISPENFIISLEDDKAAAEVEAGGHFEIKSLSIREQLVIRCAYKKQPNLVLEYMLASSDGLFGNLELKIDIRSTARSLISRCLRDLYGRRINPDLLKTEHIKDVAEAIAEVIEKSPEKLAASPLEKIESVKEAYTQMASALNSGESGLFVNDFVLMFYIAADNASSSELIESVKAINSCKLPPGMKAIIQTDSPKEGGKRYLHNANELIETASLKQINSASFSTINDFVSWAIRSYPARRYGLIMGCHAGGFKTNGSYHSHFIADETEKAFMSPLEAANALKSAVTTFSEIRRPFALLAFDSSNMAGIECAYEFKDCADYLVFTETGAMPQGFCYTEFLNELGKKDVKSLSNKDLASVLCDVYRLKYINSPAQTAAVSVVYAPAFDSFIERLSTYFSVICGNISDYGPLLAACRDSVISESSEGTEPIYKIQAFENADYRDLAHLIESTRPQLAAASNAADQVLAGFNSLVIKSYASKSKLQNAKGLYICLPSAESYIENYGGGLKLSEYTQLSFCQKTPWLEVLAGMNE